MKPNIFCYFTNTNAQQRNRQKLQCLENLLKGTGTLRPSTMLLSFAPVKIKGPHLDLCLDLHYSSSICVDLQMRTWPRCMGRYWAGRDRKPCPGLQSYNRKKKNHTNLYNFPPYSPLSHDFIQLKSSLRIHIVYLEFLDIDSINTEKYNFILSTRKALFYLKSTSYNIKHK